VIDGTFPSLGVKSRVMAEATDAELVRLSLEEPRVFERVFERHFDRVFAFLRRQVGAQLAEELCAETFTRAFDGRRRYDRGRPDAAPWLFGIATNLLREHRRRERREPAFERGVVEEQPDDRAPDLAAALEGLSPLERETLLLYAWADLSYDEIAEALAIPVGTVRSRLSRARAHMRARLAPRPKEVACDG
jgi:RNA polymerase sigma factor (sigma-70 family)